MTTADPGLYQRFIRTASIRDIVDLFYDKILKDPRINYIFDGMDMKRIRAHQREFLVYVLGGNADYTGRPLRDAHRPLVKKYGLNNTHFDAMTENLVAALRETGFGQTEIHEIMNVITSVRDEVLDL